MLHNGGATTACGDIAEQLGIPGTTGSRAAARCKLRCGCQRLWQRQHRHPAVVRQHHLPLRRQPDHHPRPAHDEDGRPVLRQQMNTLLRRQQRPDRIHGFNGHFTAQAQLSPDPPSGSPRPTSFWVLPSGSAAACSTGTWGHRKNILGFYFQDDWRATDSLTLNLGCAGSTTRRWCEVKDRQSNFEPVHRQTAAGRPGRQQPRSVRAYKKDFQPRVGFAWTPSVLGGKTVFRGAYTSPRSWKAPAPTCGCR